MLDLQKNKRTRLRFSPHLGDYDQATAYQIIDSTPFCHVSALVNGQAYSQATVHWRNNNCVYMHGAVKNQIIQSIASGEPACLSFMHFDGYVMAASAINHAVLYRSVIAYSAGRLITDLEQKEQLLKSYIESIEAGRWEKIRQPSDKELKMTGLVEFDLDTLSIKCITKEDALSYLPGGEYDDPRDSAARAWTGVIPIQLRASQPIQP